MHSGEDHRIEFLSPVSRVSSYCIIRTFMVPSRIQNRRVGQNEPIVECHERSDTFHARGGGLARVVHRSSYRTLKLVVVIGPRKNNVHRIEIAEKDK